jgi:MFS family permease
VAEALGRSFDSLRVPNYRRYFAGQLVSISGNWMQNVAEMWLVLSITGSGLAVGVTAGLQFLPMLLFGAWGGAVADRRNKRRLLLLTQALQTIGPLTLLGLAIAGAVPTAAVFAVVLFRGAVNAVDYPTRQAFVSEIVGRDRVVNAVSLNSVLVHSSRIAGPALAGILIATVGTAPCFALNALSFAVMIVALAGMDTSALRPAKPVARQPGAIREGLAYVSRSPSLWVPLALMAIVGTFGFNFQALLPLLAQDSFHAGASGYALLVSAMGAGAIVGALTTGVRNHVSSSLLVGAAAVFGLLALVASAAPSLALAAVAVVPLGAATVTLAASINSGLQLASEPSMRGRVMALYSVVFLGSTPIGAPLTGWLSDAVDPRAALVMAGASGIVGAALARVAFDRANSVTLSHLSVPRVEGGIG